MVQIQTGLEMAQAVEGAVSDADWLFMAAAVADFRMERPSEGKIKKEDLGADWSLTLVRNPDILGEVVPRCRTEKMKVVGFALETQDVEARAAAKRQAKGLDYIVANDPTAAGSGFGPGDHQVTVLGEGGVVWASPSLPKQQLAMGILDQLASSENE